MNFLTLSYWFNTRPDSLAPGALKYYGFFLLGLFVIAFLSLLQKKKKGRLYVRCWDKVFNFSIGNLGIGLVLLFFAYEGLPYLSTRVLYLFWLIGMLFWLVPVFKAFKKIPEIKQKKEQESEYKKYIP